MEGERARERERERERERDKACLCASKCDRYGVATVSRIDTIIGLFCRISSLL